MTTDEIMALAGELENAVIYFMARGSGAERIHKAKVLLRTSIESLVKDAERFNFLCDCENEQALDLLANHVGQREDLIELVDELIKEKS